MAQLSKMKSAARRHAVKTIYDSWEGVYRRHKPEDLPWYSPSVHPALKTVLDRIPVKKGKALDIGCGFGQVARYLASMGWFVTAIDISASAIRKARQLTNPDSSIIYRRQNSLSLDPDIRYELVVDNLHLHDIQPNDLNHYLSVLAEVTASWLVISYLRSNHPVRITRPSFYFRGVVTQHSHAQLNEAMSPLGLHESALDTYTLNSGDVQYDCDILTYSAEVG